MKRFWTWFFWGYAGQRGISGLFDRWLLLHLAIGVGLYAVVPLSLSDAAQRVLLPLAGVLIGLAFAWAGNSQSILASGELDPVVRKHRDGLESYLFKYQAAILYLLITLGAWGIAGLEVLDRIPSGAFKQHLLNCVGVTLYMLASISIRECWHVILSGQYFMLIGSEIRKRQQSLNTGAPEDEQ